MLLPVRVGHCWWSVTACRYRPVPFLVSACPSPPLFVPIGHCLSPVSLSLPVPRQPLAVCPSLTIVCPCCQSHPVPRWHPQPVPVGSHSPLSASACLLAVTSCLRCQPQPVPVVCLRLSPLSTTACLRCQPQPVPVVSHSLSPLSATASPRCQPSATACPRCQPQPVPVVSHSLSPLSATACPRC